METIVRQNQKGFSLIELLITLVIMAVGLLAMAEMQIASIRGNSFNNSLATATAHAQNKLEELTKLPYTDSDLDSGNHNEGSSPSSIFSRVYSIDDLSSTMKLITSLFSGPIQWATPSPYQRSGQNDPESFSYGKQRFNPG